MFNTDIQRSKGQKRRDSKIISDEIENVKNRVDNELISKLNKDKDSTENISMPSEFKIFNKDHFDRVINTVKNVKPLISKNFMDLTEYQFLDYFNKFDTSGCGFLRENEMIKMGDALGIPKDLMVRMIDEIDEDGNGEVSIDEWLVYMRQTQKQAASISGDVNIFCTFLANQQSDTFIKRQYDPNTSTRVNLHDNSGLSYHQLTGVFKLAERIKDGDKIEDSQNNDETPSEQISDVQNIKVQTQQSIHSNSVLDIDQDIKLSNTPMKTSKKHSECLSMEYIESVLGDKSEERKDTNSTVSQDLKDLENFFEESKSTQNEDNQKVSYFQNDHSTMNIDSEFNNQKIKTNKIIIKKQNSTDSTSPSSQYDSSTDSSSLYNERSSISISSIVNRSQKYVETNSKDKRKQGVGLFASTGSKILKNNHIYSKF